VLTFPDTQPELLGAVRNATASKAPLVLLSVSAGPTAFDTGLADAIVYVGYDGQEAEHGFTDVLLSELSPSARLPVTVHEAECVTKVGGMLDYSSASGVGWTCQYLNATASPPIFQFGFGLSYSKFEYSGLAVKLLGADSGTDVTVLLKIVGDREAAEVAQLCLTGCQCHNLGSRGSTR
jgi:hypothetical protein